jgi:hypothetical protein
MRITGNATVDSVREQVHELFELPPTCRLKVFDRKQADQEDIPAEHEDVQTNETVHQLVSVSFAELVAGVLDYFANDQDPAYLATASPVVLVDATPAAPVDTAVLPGSSGSIGSKRAGNRGSKGSADSVQYKPKPWARLVDSIWPFCIPR